MSPLRSIKSGYGQFLTFSGRATRSEFWWSAIFALAVILCAGALLFPETQGPVTAQVYFFGMLLLIFGALLTAIAFRRFHDVGMSGTHVIVAWAGGYLAVFLYAIAGSFVLARLDGNATADEVQALPAIYKVLPFLVSVPVFLIVILYLGFFLSRPSQPGPNKYGPNSNEVPQ